MTQLISSPMSDFGSYTLSALSALGQVELDIRQTEEDTTALEQRIHEMRHGLDLLYAQRKAIVIAAHRP
jgi:hypothetical protein